MTKLPAPNPGWTVLVIGSLAACAGSTVSEGVNRNPVPTDSIPVDSLDPRMIPDPMAVTPPVTVEPPAPVRDPRGARLLVVEGRAAMARGDTARALQRFRAALGADSLNTDAGWQLGWTLQQRGAWNDALTAWRALAVLAPDYPELALRLPILEMRRDDAGRRAALPPDSVPPPEEDPRDGIPVRIAAVGDIQLGQGWPEEDPRLPPENARPMFDRVGHWLADADITFGNLETVLADSGESTKCRRGSRNCYAFRAPTSYATTLRATGFDVLSINNNHAGDFGDAGREATVAALDHAGVLHSGPTSGVASWEVQGLRVALIAFSTGSADFRIQDIAAARQHVLDADRGHDLVFVSFHGGAEGSAATRVPREVEHAFGENRGDVYAFSHAMVDAGADLVLGHGPHVLRGMEVYRGRMIAYSLGNFSAWHGFNLRGPLGVSTVLTVTLSPNGVVTDATIHPLFLERPGIPTPDPEGRAIAIVRGLSLEDLGDALFDEAGRYTRQAVGDSRF